MVLPSWTFFFYFILCLSLLYCLAMVTCWERADFFAPMFVMFSCVFVTFPYDILGQVWYLLVSIPDLCLLPYFFSTKPPYYPLIQCSNKSADVLFITNERTNERVACVAKLNFCLMNYCMSYYAHCYILKV